MAGRAQSWDQLREDAPAPTDPGPGGLSPPPPDSGIVTYFIPILSLHSCDLGATVWVPQSCGLQRSAQGAGWPGERGRAPSCALSTSSDCPVIGERILLLKQSEPPSFLPMGLPEISSGS